MFKYCLLFLCSYSERYQKHLQCIRSGIRTRSTRGDSALDRWAILTVIKAGRLPSSGITCYCTNVAFLLQFVQTQTEVICFIFKTLFVFSPHFSFKKSRPFWWVHCCFQWETLFERIARPACDTIFDQKMSVASS